MPRKHRRGPVRDTGPEVCRASPRFRPGRPPIRSTEEAIGAVGLAVSAPTWVPLVVARLRFPSDSLQVRYSILGGHDLVLPSPVEEAEFAGLVGLAKVEFGDHQRFTLLWAMSSAVVMLATTLLLGVIPLVRFG